MNGDYKFNIDDFSGPLDVLLLLVKEQKKDILDIDMVKLANQYLEFISKIKDDEINLSSSYLLMASYLLELKSRAILPLENKDVDEEFFESEKQKLIEKLIEYRKYKEQIPFFEKKLVSRLQYFTKEPSDLKPFAKFSQEERFSKNLNNFTLIRAIKRMFELQNLSIMKEVSYVSKSIDPKEVEHYIMNYLQLEKNLTFSKICEKEKTIQYFLVSFICVLDLAKSNLINLVQLEKFDKIYIKKRILKNG